MLEQSEGHQSLGVTEVTDNDLFQKPSSLPNDNQFLHAPPDEVGSYRNSTASDEETDVGFINKTRSFPDLTNSTHAQQQQALAIQEARLRKREEALQQKEMNLQRQQNEVMMRGYPRVYSGEQPVYGSTGYNWSGTVAYSGQQSSQGTPATYIYHHNEQQWSRPHGERHYCNEHCNTYSCSGNLTQELNHLNIRREPTAVLMPQIYDVRYRCFLILLT